MTMPRTARALQGGYCYHVLNRGNRRRQVFYKEADYSAFLTLMSEACLYQPMRILADCLMPNHFHFVLWPQGDKDISRWMHWLMTTHVRRYHRHYGSNGHLWQGRFKAFPIEQDDHLLTVIRYVERNPLRANLVDDAAQWHWSSIGCPPHGVTGPSLHPGPMSRGSDWCDHVNRPLTEAELKAVRQSVVRGNPYGSSEWTQTTVARLGLESTLRPPVAASSFLPFADSCGQDAPPGRD